MFCDLPRPELAGDVRESIRSALVTVNPQELTRKPTPGLLSTMVTPPCLSEEVTEKREPSELAANRAVRGHGM